MSVLLSNLSTRKGDPLYLTYAAPLSRSGFAPDQGYRLVIDDDGIRFFTEKAGHLAVAFQQGVEVRSRLTEFSAEPCITASYADLVRYRYRPFHDLLVDAFFLVYSSRLALLDFVITNTGGVPAEVTVFPYLHHPECVREIESGPRTPQIVFRHNHEPDEWTSSNGVPHVTERVNVLLIGSAPDSTGVYAALDTTGGAAGTFFGDLGQPRLAGGGSVKAGTVLAFQRRLTLAPGASKRVRLIRGTASAECSIEALISESKDLLAYDTSEAVRDNEALYNRIPPAPTIDPDWQLAYWSAFSLLRQVMLPPEGASSYNYYVFSREPTWGWGHGGQVFHESLAMLAYVFMDPEGALNSQRVYFERQHDDGYINYRTGPYLDETIEHDGDRTSSGPFFSWINLELYDATLDRSFLEDAYVSGSRFFVWWLANRDTDRDGLAEWGGHAVLESLRDGLVAVWHTVGRPSNFEALDLNVMLVKEARALATMARALGDIDGAARWTTEADARTNLINETFWDEESGFFYHVDRDDHEFTFSQPNDLKRQEIIGFLPLWAGTATQAQAARLVEHLTDPAKFWRPNGVPSLAADDSYYDPMGYWNGPVWPQWQYLIFRGLLDYGYHELAEQLARKVLESVTQLLRTTHTFWELYSPDHLWGGHHHAYIWTGLVARILIDLERTPAEGRPVDTAFVKTERES